MRIALLSKRSPSCGVVTYSRQLEQHWRRWGHTVDFLHFATEADRQPGDVALPAWWKTQPYTLPAPASLAALRQYLVTAKPDLLHAHLTVSPLDWVVPGLCRSLGIPTLATFHTGWDDRPTRFGLAARALYRLYAPAVARYDRTIVFGSAQQRAFIDRGVPAERLAIVPNGIDAAAYAPGPSPYRLETGLRITYMGRMVPEKHVTALVETFVAAAVPGLRLTMVGDGPLLTPLQRRFKGHAQIDWLGHVADEDERRAIWRGSDVVVLPSAIEGLSLSLLEGMASGCMPLATDVGAHRDVLAGVGHVLDPGRVGRDLVKAWVWLADNPAEVRQLGESARRRVLEWYTLEKHWRRLAALYQELGGVSPTPTGPSPSSSPI